MSYKIAILNPRPQAAAEMDALFAENTVFGIEVTVPAFAARCIENLDHHGADSWREPAILQALKVALPPNGAVLATIRPDLDSFGAMALLELRLVGIPINVAVLERILRIAETDVRSLQSAQRWEPAILPTSRNFWPNGENSELAAVAAMVSDSELSPWMRAGLMRFWLLEGEPPARYIEQVCQERLMLVHALEDGTIQRAVSEGVATVVSTHRAATTIGYSLAPVVVAFNPAFKAGAGEPYAKFTICQHAASYVALPAVFAKLSAREPGWGGSATIGGSPQGVSSQLSLEEVVAVVKKHLL